MRFGKLAIGSAFTFGLLASSAAMAGPIHDFSPGAEATLGPSLVVGPVTAEAFYYDTVGGVWTSTNLTRRNVANDHGLGVCSAGETCTYPGDGDDNELSQLTNTEAIRFTLAPGYVWDGLWLSSLDSGGTDNAENGKVYWGNSPSIAALLGGPSASFKYPAFAGTAVEGELTIAGFDNTAKYVVFLPGSGTSTKGSNEDYLVWGADTKAVPDGATTVSLLGLALVGLGALRRTFRI
jgi:hypothetical protein